MRTTRMIQHERRKRELSSVGRRCARKTFYSKKFSQQVFQLESMFDHKRYLSSAERTSLAQTLRLTETQVRDYRNRIKVQE